MRERHLSGKEDTDKQDQRLRSSASELVLQLFENQPSHPCLLSTLTPSSTLRIARKSTFSKVAYCSKQNRLRNNQTLIMLITRLNKYSIDYTFTSWKYPISRSLYIHFQTGLRFYRYNYDNRNSLQREWNIKTFSMLTVRASSTYLLSWATVYIRR